MKMFPVLWQCKREVVAELERIGCPRSVPWSVVADHEQQARRNHDQTLTRLAQRGGLSPVELLAVLTDTPLGIDMFRSQADIDAVPALLKLLEDQ